MGFHHRFVAEKGFSLIEVLVATVIFAIGIMGFAALQMTGLRYAHNANLRFQASLQVNDITDRMRANLPGAAAGNYNFAKGGAITNRDCSTTDCSASQMAQYDLYQWQTQNALALPSGKGSITSNADGTYTVDVSWEQRRGLKDLNNGTETKSFSLNFKP